MTVAAHGAARPVPELELLNDAVADLARAGRLVPCAGRPEWLSDAAEDAAQAAEACGRCVLSRACLAAGLAARATAGVWGGRNLGNPDVRRSANSKETR